MAEPDYRRIARNLHMVASLTKRVLEEGPAEEATFAQISILKWLDAATPRRAQDVAKFISASAPAATQILNRLKQKGFVRSNPDPEDRRREELHLTAKGKKAVKGFEDRKANRIQTMLKNLPDDQRKQLIPGLEAAVALLMLDTPTVEDMCLHCGVHASPACVMRRHGYRCPTERPGLIPCGSPPARKDSARLRPSRRR